MNKYELAVVVSAKIENDERAAVIEKVKDIITTNGGNITTTSFSSKVLQQFLLKLSQEFVSLRTLLDICA